MARLHCSYHTLISFLSSDWMFFLWILVYGDLGGFQGLNES